MLVDKGVIKVGTEIEIVGWNKGRTYQSIAAELIDADYMLGPPEIWANHHKYHCSCPEGGCGDIRKGELIVPQPLVSITYDGTLPKTGAEFIISPILLADRGFRDQLEEVWGIITKDAIWTMEGIDYHGNNGISPSIHLHVSATLTNNNKYTKAAGYRKDILHALSLFSPELILLANSAGVTRGLKYRLPLRSYIHEDEHHGFIQVRNANEGQVYIEWRMVEAAYQDWDYIEGCAYMAAGITRSLLDKSGMSWFMSTGYAYPYKDEHIAAAIATDDTNMLLELVSKERLYMLHDICMSHLSDDSYGMQVVDKLFARAKGTI